MPVSQQKLNALADAIHYEFKFIKENYVFKKKNTACKVTDLYDQFCNHCLEKGVKTCSKNEFINKFREVQINFLQNKWL